ncbi:MAG: DUF3467 domain-containing protein [Desulfobacteraceae bacterium]|jgi:hypothetical protein
MKQNDSNAQPAIELEGRYADRFHVGYRSSVFVLDFEQSFMDEEKEHIHTRIITSPEDAKIFLELLQKTIGQYEKSHGAITAENKDELRQYV